MSPSSFWDLSIKEIYDVIDAHNFKSKNEFKEKAILNNVLAMQIAENVSKIFDSSNKTYAIWDYFPELFNDEKESHDDYVAEQQWKAWKANFESYANVKGSRKEANK